MNQPKSFLIADSSPLYRQAFTIAARQLSVPCAVREVNCYLDLKNQLQWQQFSSLPDIDFLVVDQRLAGLQTLAQVQCLTELIDAPLVMTADAEDQRSLRIARLVGARALLPKSLTIARFSAILDSVLEGECWYPDGHSWGSTSIREETALRYLSSSELKVISRVRDGWRNKQIAHALNLSECTIKTHLSSAYRKLAIDNRTQLAILTQGWTGL